MQTKGCGTTQKSPGGTLCTSKHSLLIFVSYSVGRNLQQRTSSIGTSSALTLVTDTSRKKITSLLSTRSARPTPSMTRRLAIARDSPSWRPCYYYRWDSLSQTWWVHGLPVGVASLTKCAERVTVCLVSWTSGVFSIDRIQCMEM